MEPESILALNTGCQWIISVAIWNQVTGLGNTDSLFISQKSSWTSITEIKGIVGVTICHIGFNTIIWSFQIYSSLLNLILSQNEVGLLRITHEGKYLRQIEIGDLHESSGAAVTFNQFVSLTIGHLWVGEATLLINWNNIPRGTLETDCLGVLDLTIGDWCLDLLTISIV